MTHDTLSDRIYGTHTRRHIYFFIHAYFPYIRADIIVRIYVPSDKEQKRKKCRHRHTAMPNNNNNNNDIIIIDFSRISRKRSEFDVIHELARIHFPSPACTEHIDFARTNSRDLFCVTLTIAFVSFVQLLLRECIARDQCRASTSESRINA